MDQKSNIRIIFWSTPEFALPTLEALIKNGYNIVAVVTNPDEPMGRKNILTPPPTKVWANKHNIPVLQSHTLVNYKLQITNYKPDLFIVAAYGKIIPREILDIPKFGALNIHPSLLPRWRGPSPIQYTILQGDTETGVTIIKMDELMDHGPIVAKRQLANYKLQITNYKILHDELAKLGTDLLVETLPKWIDGRITPIPQDDSKATYSKILKKDDGRITWSRPAIDIERMIRALNPWPGTWTLWPSGEKIYRIRIEEGEAIEEEPPQGSYGFTWQSSTHPLLIKTGYGSIVVKKLTLEGKKSLHSQDFLRGLPKFINTSLI